MAEPRVAEEAITSPTFRVKGQRSRWRYPDARLTPEHCEILRDVNISERGSADTRYGFTTYNATQLSGGEMGVGLWEGKFTGATTRRVVVTPTAVYSDDGATRTTITGTGLTGGNDDRVRFVFLKDQLILNNGVDQVRTWTGSLVSNTANITGTPWTKVDDIFVHKNLLLALAPTEGGTKYPTRCRWCDINRQTYVVDITTWRDTNRYEIYDGGPAIVGGVDNWGMALIFKEDGLYPGEIVYDQLGHYDFRLGNPIHGFSPLSKMSLRARPEFVVGVAREGLFVIRPDLSFEVVNTDDAAEWFGLNLGRLQYAQTFFREKDHQARVLCSSSGNTAGHDRVLVWDWETGDVWLDRPRLAMNFGERVVVSNEELDWLAGTGGYLFQGNKSTYRYDNGSPFSWRIKMAANDLGLQGKLKHVLNLTTIYRRRAGASSISLRVSVDEGRQSSVSKSLSVGTTNKWNSGLKWNSGKKWGGSNARRVDTEINRICETIQPEWYGEDPVGIDGYQVEFVPLEG